MSRDPNKWELKDWAEGEAENFHDEYGDGNCSCYISPPCGSCVHPGNPANLEETDDAWKLVYYPPSNLRYSVSRNKREGLYAGKSRGKHFRCPSQLIKSL